MIIFYWHMSVKWVLQPYSVIPFTVNCQPVQHTSWRTFKSRERRAAHNGDLAPLRQFRQSSYDSGDLSQLSALTSVPVQGNFCQLKCAAKVLYCTNVLSYQLNINSDGGKIKWTLGFINRTTSSGSSNLKQVLVDQPQFSDNWCEQLYWVHCRASLLSGATWLERHLAAGERVNFGLFLNF